ncbi:MAG: AAA family ATPase [Magnetococcales bacterium]|nr:AAA family ATPase [Magnetococcales bacterium]
MAGASSHYETKRLYAGSDPKALRFVLVESHRPVWKILRSATALAEGSVIVTGRAGCGKTQLLHRLHSVVPKDRDVALILDPTEEPDVFLKQLVKIINADTVFSEDDEPLTANSLFDAMEHRAKTGRKLLLAVDRIEEIPDKNLEYLGLIMSFSANELRPVQMVLAGDVDLGALDNDPLCKPIMDTLVGSGELLPLSYREIPDYVDRLLEKSGHELVDFSFFGWVEFYRITRGVPSHINQLLGGALGLIETKTNRLVTGSVVRRAARASGNSPGISSLVLVMVAVIASLTGLIAYLLNDSTLFASSSEQQRQVLKSVQKQPTKTPTAKPVDATHKTAPKTKPNPPKILPRDHIPQAYQFSNDGFDMEGSLVFEGLPRNRTKLSLAFSTELKTLPWPKIESVRPLSVSRETVKTPGKLLPKESVMLHIPIHPPNTKPKRKLAAPQSDWPAPLVQNGSLPVKNSTSNSHRVVIEVGSYLSQDNADAIVKRLRTQKLDPFILHTRRSGQDWYSVRLGYEDWHKAEATAQKIRKEQDGLPVKLLEEE